MINKVAAYERAEVCNSRYKAMVRSDSPADRANAEAYRLATQEWQSIAKTVGPNNAGFDAQFHLNTIRSRWDKYVNTGVAHDSLESLASEYLRRFIEDDRKMRMCGVEGCTEDADRSKKVKPPESRPITPDDPRNFVDPMAIEGVLNEFRLAFGMPLVGFSMGKVE
jgi:hypothetical protein